MCPGCGWEKNQARVTNSNISGGRPLPGRPTWQSATELQHESFVQGQCTDVGLHVEKEENKSCLLGLHH